MTFDIPVRHLAIAELLNDVAFAITVAFTAKVFVPVTTERAMIYT
jgi:hypothetical protein